MFINELNNMLFPPILSKKGSINEVFLTNDGYSINVFVITRPDLSSTLHGKFSIL